MQTVRNNASAINFDRKFQERGSQILDTVFAERPDLRLQVSLKSPRVCKQREVVFNVNYESKSEFSEILATLCQWMKQEHSQSDLEGLMLF